MQMYGGFSIACIVLFGFDTMFDDQIPGSQGLLNWEVALCLHFLNLSKV